MEGSEMDNNWPENLLLVALFIIITLFTAFQEGYLPMIAVLFWLFLITGFAISIWLALKVSTGRLLAMMLAIFIIEYIKETIGIRSGMWEYHSPHGPYSYNFGVWAWVMGGMTVFWLAVRVVIRLVKKLTTDLPRRWNLLNPIIVVLVFAIIPLTLGDYWGGAGGWFWGLYAVLFLVTLVTAVRMDLPVFLGLLITTWIIGFPSEFVGSSGCLGVGHRIWEFAHNPNFPPLFLILGCWPLEIFTQYALAAFLAREPLDHYTFSVLDAGRESVEPSGSQALKGHGHTTAPHLRGESTMHLTKEECHFRLFLRLSAITYLVVGLAFAVFPGDILRLINHFAVYANLIPSLGQRIPIADGEFWLSLAFSMMMTITVLCCMAQHHVRKNKGFVIALLVAKAASSLSSLGFFLFHHPKYFATLVIFLVDGSIFWITLYFFLRANQAFLKAQTAWFEVVKPPKSAGPTTVVAFKGADKLALLDQVLEASRFFEILNMRFQETGKSNKKNFKVVIKPNFMFMHSRKDISTYTDPELVEALVDRIYDLGFTNITLVEAQSTYGNYYQNRDVLSVAQYVGYSLDKDGYSPDKKYRMVDLTKEMVPYDYGNIPVAKDPFGYCRRLGRHFVGPTWRDADFRISFAKNKTHCFCNYTLTLKNVYGTLPMQNKLKEYHTKRDYSWPTIAALTHFPVHFGLIDAFTSADGQFGVIECPEPKLTKTIIGGESLVAVDWVGAYKMGLDPDDPTVGQFLPLAVATWGKPDIKPGWDQSCYDPWENVDQSVVDSLDMIEKAYAFSNWWFGVLTDMDPYFAFNWRGRAALLMRKIIAPFKRLFYEEIEI
jgi:uncharacterized protein (DUF362 family)